MTWNQSFENHVGLAHELCKLAGASEWLEFKVNSHEPRETGE